MENCVVQEITYIDEYIELCEIASKSNHTNASNYNVDKMKKRWNKYLIFTKLTRGDELISFAGIVDFGNNLVRVADRLYTKQEYRQNFMTKKVVYISTKHTLIESIEILKSSGFRHLPIYYVKKQKFYGIISYKDFLLGASY